MEYNQYFLQWLCTGQPLSAWKKSVVLIQDGGYLSVMKPLKRQKNLMPVGNKILGHENEWNYVLYVQKRVQWNWWTLEIAFEYYSHFFRANHWISSILDSHAITPKLSSHIRCPYRQLSSLHSQMDAGHNAFNWTTPLDGVLTEPRPLMAFLTEPRPLTALDF